MKDSNTRIPGPRLGDKMEFESPSWNQTYSLILKLSEAIQKSGFEPDIIVGVSRGGWIPARILSDLLENPNLANVSAEFYVGIAKTKQKPTILQSVSLPVNDKKVLVVDDLADTGESLKLVTEHLENQGASEVRIATIYYKPWSIIIPHYYEKETRCWIVFPWELKETVRKAVKKFISEGRTMEDTKKKLINSGLDRKLTEQFIKEIVGEEH